MAFNEFANMLMCVLAGGYNNAEFSRELVRNITDIPHYIEDNPIDNLTDSTWKKYLNGTRSIRNTARKINKYIDDEKFVTYIDDLSDGARFYICDKLKSTYPEVNNRNVAEICASLFKSILLESAQSKRNTNKIVSNNTALCPKCSNTYALSG